MELLTIIKPTHNSVRSERLLERLNNIFEVKVCSSSKWKIVKSVLKTDAGCILFYNFYGRPFLLPLLILAKIRGIKTITRVDIAKRWLYGYSLYIKLKTSIARILFTIEGLLVDTLWTAVRYRINLAEKTLGIPIEKFVHIPRPVPFEVGNDEKSNYLLAVSNNFCDIKNLHGALEVFAEVSKDKNDLELWIVGKFTESLGIIKIDKESMRTGEKESGREYRRRCMDKIEELGIGDRVKFLGPKHGDELRDIYRRAKIYYLPTKNYLGTTTFTEAIAGGTPVVTRDCPGLARETVGDDVCGFLKNSKEGQKKAILKLLNDDELYAKMEKNCLKKAEDFSPDRVMEKWEETLSELCS